MIREATLNENDFLRKLSAGFLRSQRQVNAFLESDAELVKLADGSVLALTTDSIIEEIAAGLYSDPTLIGWMTVVVNLSDIAAVGAEPLGLLLSQNIPKDYPPEKLDALQSGIAQACEAFGVFVLGGDTNQSAALEAGGTAVGLIKSGPIISRKGAKPGDLLYVSGKMGLGSAFAFSVLMGGTSVIPYKPVPKLKEGALVRLFGSSCMDTSDGLFPAICNLMETNGIGFEFNLPFSEIAHPAVVQLAAAGSLPTWFFLAGPHGEFELIFTIPPEKEPDFLETANQMNWFPLKIGKAIEYKTCVLDILEGRWPIEPFQISNLFTEAGGNPKAFLSALVQKQASWKLPL
jgi:thiamine-monophosphate kinase